MSSAKVHYVFDTKQKKKSKQKVPQFKQQKQKQKSVKKKVCRILLWWQQEHAE
jgi:transcription initiation factor TFIID subunit TAF12